ncbi:MAG: hypothetical protein WBI20_08545 [Burkholderiaceae bacterium]
MSQARPSQGPDRQPNELLLKGILCSLIGLGVLLSPHFIVSPGMQNIVANATLVGWFSLVLGCALIAVWARKRWSVKKPD